MKKINWRVRFKNPLFIFQIILSILVPILGYYGLEMKDLTSWPTFFDILANALSNPYVLGLIGVSLFNAINDPVTKGYTDSERALGYREIK